MAINDKIAQIRAYAVTAKTAIYNEDAMTAIELAGVTACKVNECVNTINLLIDLIDEVSTAVGLTYDAENEGITI